MKKILLMVLMMTAAIIAQASVSIDPQAAWVYSDNGSTQLGTDKLVAWIVDVEGDGFGDWSSIALGLEGFTIDDDDVLLGVGSSGSAGEGLVWNTFVWNNVASPNVQGKQFAMLWFDKDYVGGETGVGAAGINYGVFETGEIVPNDGVSGETYAWYTQDVGGSLANDTFHATYQSIPEPASAVLALIGGGLAYAIRRRGHRFVS